MHRVQEHGPQSRLSPVGERGPKARASEEEPQYLIKSDTTDHLAMDKGSALKIFKNQNERGENEKTPIA